MDIYVEREISKEDFKRLVELAADRLSFYMIGFVQFEDGTDHPHASIAGSGTLVVHRGHQGVLTASHVIRNLRKQARMGLVYSGSRGTKVVFETSACEALEFVGEGDEAEGPDLGFLILPIQVTSALAAVLSFYNLENRTGQIQNGRRPLDNGFWGITGFIAEFSKEGPPRPGFARNMQFVGGFGQGHVSREEDRDGFDYLFYEALYNEHYEGPESFAGYSGGGLWQLEPKFKNGNWDIGDTYLCGVAFYQSAKTQNTAGEKIREITCHGPLSLARLLRERLE